MNPAAVELHATLDLLDESPSKVTLTADTASERAALPEASSLGGSLLLADRGYFDRDYLLELTKAGASFVIRAQQGLNPKVLEALDAQGQRIRQFCGKPLKTLRFAKRGAVDLRVRWKVQDQSLECRLIVTWNSSTKEPLAKFPKREDFFHGDGIFEQKLEQTRRVGTIEPTEARGGVRI